MQMPDCVWVVGSLVFRGRVDDGCTVVIETGRQGARRDRREVRLVGQAVEQVGARAEGDRFALEARVVGARRSLVAHRLHPDP